MSSSPPRSAAWRSDHSFTHKKRTNSSYDSTNGYNQNRLHHNRQPPPICDPSEIRRKYFEKKFEFCTTFNYQLPQPNDDGCAITGKSSRLNPWADKFAMIKERLNDVKNRLNDYPLEEWSKHTHKRDPAGGIGWSLNSGIHAEFVTKAWCKFYELLSSYPVVRRCIDGRFNSMHLCEAPGAFVAALNHFLQLNLVQQKVIY